MTTKEHETAKLLKEAFKLEMEYIKDSHPVYYADQKIRQRLRKGLPLIKKETVPFAVLCFRSWNKVRSDKRSAQFSTVPEKYENVEYKTIRTFTERAKHFRFVWMNVILRNPEGESKIDAIRARPNHYEFDKENITLRLPRLFISGYKSDSDIQV